MFTFSKSEQNKKSSKKKIISQFNKDTNDMINTYLSRHYDEIKNVLIDNGMPEDEIEQAIQRIKQRMQVGAINLYKEELKAVVLERINQSPDISSNKTT